VGVAELRLGYKASAEQFAPRELVELGVLAEEHGMDSASVSDHFNPWRHEGGHSPFALSWMTAVGERTKRIMLGTSVLTPTFRYNPAVIAQAFATMGCLYPGRVFLGVGTGEALNEIATGAITEWPEFKERFARLREAVTLIRTLWREDNVSFDGDYYRTINATVFDKPEHEVLAQLANILRGRGPHRLDDALLLQQAIDRLRRLSAVGKPILRPLLVDLDQRGTALGFDPEHLGDKIPIDGRRRQHHTGRTDRGRQLCPEAEIRDHRIENFLRLHDPELILDEGRIEGAVGLRREELHLAFGFLDPNLRGRQIPARQ
jgi:hypothetical protein